MTAARYRAALRHLHRDTRGATIIEFALTAPILLIMTLGIFDFSHTLYTRAQLQGIVQKVARDSTLETADTTEQARLDERVRAQALPLANNATITITRRFYRTFSEAAAARPEAWTDTNKNGNCDANEPYQDENRNSSWDRDGGNAGQGGAKDATVYTVVMAYPRLFPLPNFIGSGAKTTKVTAATVLKNQPFSDQNSYGAAVVRNCTP